MKTWSRWLRTLIVALGLGSALLVASQGLIEATLKKRLMSGHDTSAYAIYLTENHDNFKSGNLVPLWAQHLRYGYGEPHLGFRPPLQTFTAELFYLLTGHPYVALNLTCMLFLILASVGMYQLARRVLGLLSDTTGPQEVWAPLFAGCAYVLSPYVLGDIYVRGAFSETSCFPVLPWLALAFLRVARKPGPQTFGAAAAMYALLAMSHAPVHLFTSPFLVAAAALYRKSIRSMALYLGALALGSVATAFYWAAALLESHQVKSLLFGEGAEAYVHYFIRLDQFVYSPWNFVSITPAFGPVIWAGLLPAIWQWAHRQSTYTVSDTRWRLVRNLLGSCLVCFYFMHATSAFWYERLPWLQMMSFPWRFLTIATFFGILLSTVVLSGSRHAKWVFTPTLLAAGVYAFIHARPESLAGYAENHFTGQNIATYGMGWEKPHSTSATAGSLPTQMAPAPVELTQGRGEIRCARLKPTLIECETMNIQNSTYRFNTFDYPHWTATIDGELAANAGRVPFIGTLWATVPPGKHILRWELRDTKTRLTTKIVSVLGWLVIFGLLFQDQLVKAKALLPKRKENLDK